MGRLGPLTSQALGRSPYDDVVPGEGEGSRSAPRQQYDDRGRPICPETKRINKDVIRSHNEVMQVIGVAEPEDGVQEAQNDLAMRHTEYEEHVGNVLCHVGRVLEMGALWGVNGTRLRILLYKQYARIPFYDLFRFEREQRSLSLNLLAGLPSFVVSQTLRLSEVTHPAVWRNRWARAAMGYIRLHLEIFVFMQRIGLVSPTTWIPRPMFFVPFSTLSPIAPLPRLSAPSWTGLLHWLGEFAVGAAPFAMFYAYTRVWVWVTRMIWIGIYDRLPRPSNPDAVLTSVRRQLRGQEQRNMEPAEAQSSPIQPPPAAESATSPGDQPRQENVLPDEQTSRQAMQRDEQTMRALEGQDEIQSRPPPVGALRRQSTLSARGDEYDSDEEETGVVSATLISFDVEQTESADTPPGIWAAELRPNVSDPRSTTQQQRDTGPLYRENALTTLPTVLATDALVVVPAGIIIAPVKALALRAIAHAFLARSGLGADGIYGINPFSDMSIGAIVNFLGVETVLLLTQGDVWAIMTMIVQSFRMTGEEWNELHSAEAHGVPEG